MTRIHHGASARRGQVAVAALLVVLCGTPAAAQRLPIRTFYASDGLGSSFVNSITQDAAGYVWFATRDGLSRWNGYEFTTVAQAGGFSVPTIDQVGQLRSGEYFVICNDGSLYAYRPPRPGERHGQGRIAFVRRSVRVDGKEVLFTRLYEDPAGTLWGGGQGVLVKGVGSTDTPIPLANPVPPVDALVVVTALLEDRGDSLWIGTNWGLFRLLPDGRLSHYALAPRAAGDPVNALALDNAGRLWIGHGRLGIVVFNPGPAATAPRSQTLSVSAAKGEVVQVAPRPGEAVALTAANGLPADEVFCLLLAPDGQLWVGTGGGLARFDGASFTRYTKEHGLCDNIVHALFEDADRHLWVATPTGAMRIVLEGFAGYTAAEGLATDHVVSVGETPEGTVYALGVDWSVNAFDGRRFIASRLPLPPGSSSMWASQAAYRDREGRWWGLTNQGLYRFDRTRGARTGALPAANRIYTARDGLPSSHVFRLYQDRSGALWVGTRSGDAQGDGLARLDPTLQRVVAFGSADGLPSGSAPSAFPEDRHGDLWIGFYQGGLARYRGGRFRTFTSRDGFSDGMVTALLVDKEGRLWVSTNLGGIARLDDPSSDRPSVRTYSTKDGLTSNNVRALAADRDGRIFAGSARGVDRLEPATGTVRHFGTEDGLLSDFVTSAFCDSRGDLWFGTYGGVFRLRPGPERAEEPPSIVITGLRVAGESLPVLELGEPSIGGLVLDADQRDIAIDFLSVSRQRAQAIVYQYALDPAHASWSRPTASRSVNFARLAPGSYTFAVRAVTPGVKVSRTPAMVAFTIRPPLWQRWWVIALAGATLAGLLAGLYRYRVRKLLEIQRLRMGIASDLHDEVATNLSSIAMFGMAVGNELGRPSPLLDRITVLATESLEAIREIVWSIDPNPETIASLVVRLRDAMVASCRARGMHLSVSLPSQGIGQNLTPDQRKNVWLMLKEAVTNAVKHSGAANLAVTVVRAGRQTRITVQDDGRGFEPSTASGGRGLTTMRTRAEALGGTAAVTSAPGKGTTVEFLVTVAE